MMTDVLIVIAFVLAAAFPISYRRSKWTLYLPGKALMAFSIIVTLVLGLGVYRVIFDQFAPSWVRGVSYGLVILGLGLMDVVLWREQYRDRHQLEPERQETTR